MAELLVSSSAFLYDGLFPDFPLYKKAEQSAVSPSEIEGFRSGFVRFVLGNTMQYIKGGDRSGRKLCS
ncbi:MAG: hypothetical protein UFD80_00895 [Blautia sp.]|nr:hypothetical protein [Blautia sp.]